MLILVFKIFQGGFSFLRRSLQAMDAQLDNRRLAHRRVGIAIRIAAALETLDYPGGSHIISEPCSIDDSCPLNVAECSDQNAQIFLCFLPLDVSFGPGAKEVDTSASR